jgi:glucose/mannose-6-phosphate isomerase
MNMKDLIATFTSQLEEAIETGRKAQLCKPLQPIHNVLISGLGGSGIGGTIVSQLSDKQIKVPVVVNKDYFIPAFTGKNTLAIICSYSGNTEETLQAMEDAINSGAKVCCISSGGKVIELAKEKGLDHIIISGGRPPRSAFAYSFTQLFYVLHGYGLIDRSFEESLLRSVRLLNSESEHIKAEAYYLAEKLHRKIPVIYSDASFEGVAIRFRQQINENAKMLCWHHALPEMNHNELVGWTTSNDKLAVVFFRNETDYKRTRARMELTKQIVSKYTPYVFEIWSKGLDNIERTLYLVHLGDWISWYLSELKQIDATEVKVIDFLKGELAKV